MQKLTVSYNVYSTRSRTLKGQCHEIFYIVFFWLKRFDPGSIKTGKNGFANFFVFSKIFDCKVRKSGVRVVKDYVDTQIFLQMPRFSMFLIFAIRYVNTPKYNILPDCSFKICDKPSKFSKSVCIVIDVSAQSLTTPTPNFRKYQI